MTTKREYLVSKGLAKPTRGRYSREAVAELERARQAGMTFSDDTQKSEVEGSPEEGEPAPIVSRIKPDPKVRDIKEVFGYTEEGIRVASGVCFKCRAHVSRCACAEGITPAHGVVKWADESRPYGKALDPALPV